MSAKDLSGELLKVDAELKSIDEEIAKLKNRRRKLVERRQQLETALHNAASKRDQNKDFWESTNFEWSSELTKNLKSLFRLDDFRPGQLSALNATLSSEDVILIMSTGGGKSLCYQLPATIRSGFTLVISPLISLMEDQLIALKKFGINGTMLNQNCTQKETTAIQDAMLDRNSNLKLVFVTPEKLAKSKRFMSKLEKCNEAGRLQRIAIDEVHCCSQWGHDFRPDYKFLNILRRQFPKVPILGLTATATGTVIDDVKSMLNIPAALTFRASFNRKNLDYEVRIKPNDAESQLSDLVNVINNRFNEQSGIIYCFSKKETEELVNGLRNFGIRAACYHADLSAEVRSKVHEKWLANRYHVIVATIAFGMGIDKPDVRYVIHHTLAKSLENYYQESGRAGRDDGDAVCLLYYRYADVFRQSSMVCTEKTGLDNLMAMVRYCNDSSNCRRKLIADHFGETWTPDWCSAKCDSCRRRRRHDNGGSSDRRLVNLVSEARILIEILKRSQQKLTGLKLVDEFSKKCKSLSTPTSRERLVMKLLLDDYLKLDFHFTPYNIITYVALGSKAAYLENDDCEVYMDDSSQLLLPVQSEISEKASKKRKIVDEASSGGGSSSSSSLQRFNNEIIEILD